MFTILCRPDLLNAPYRELAAAAGVALGTVGPVIKNLEAAKHVATFGTVRKMRRLIDADRLVEEWVTFYPAALRTSIFAGFGFRIGSECKTQIFCPMQHTGVARWLRIG